MLCQGEPLMFCNLETVLSAATTELQRNKDKLKLLASKNEDISVIQVILASRNGHIRLKWTTKIVETQFEFDELEGKRRLSNYI